MALAYGMDVSFYEKKIDWFKVRDQGFSFVFIKASQADFEDSSFKSHWAGAKNAGILRAGYHFYRENVSAHTQAQTFANLLKDDSGELPPILDIEHYRGQPLASPRQVARGIEIWLREVEIRLKMRPMVYTGAGFWNGEMRIDGAYPVWAPSYKLWVANYKTLPFPERTTLTVQNIMILIEGIAHGLFTPTIPKSWDQWTFWQFSGDKYFIDGVETLTQDNQVVKAAVDLNVYNGTPDQLRAWARQDTPRYVDITKYTNQKVLAAFLMAFGGDGGTVVSRTGLLPQLAANPTALYTGPQIQDIPNLTFEEELALHTALSRQISHQKLINAFREAFGEANYREVVTRAGIAYIFDRPQDPYTGPAIDTLALTEAEKQAVKARLPMQ